MQSASVTNMIIQVVGIAEDKRARVMSYYTMAFFGAAPLGNLFAGALADRIGVSYTIMLTGACCVASAVWFTLQIPRIQANHVSDLSGSTGVPEDRCSINKAEPGSYTMIDVPAR